MQQDIVLETLESMKDYVPKLAAASEQIAHGIQTHQAGWFQTLLDYLEGLVWLITAINGIQRLDQQVLEKLDLETLVTAFDQMRIAMEQQDFVSLCDLLQYELQPLLQAYDNELREIVH